MTDETVRLIAWSAELRRMHERLRHALRIAREATASGRAAASRDLLLYCHGFCRALDQHHRGEDTALFPAIERERPDLAPVLRRLEQDNSMMSHLIGGLQRTVDAQADQATLEGHLDGLAAIMESHFRYEERQLLVVLDALDLSSVPRDALGTL